MFAGKNEIWISADRQTSLKYDTATGYCHLYVGNTVVASWASNAFSLFGGTPVTPQSLPSAVATTAATNGSPWGFTTSTQANAIVSAVNSLRTIVAAYGLAA